jgi:hypothetical protein
MVLRPEEARWPCNSGRSALREFRYDRLVGQPGNLLVALTVNGK